MIRTMVILMSLFAFMTVLPGYAGDTKQAKGESSACCSADNCTQCQAMCEKMLKYCKKKGGKHASAEHINIMKDCITLCRACSDLDATKSEFAAKLHELCAEACRKCADSCKSLNDKKLAQCVEMCNTCAKSCSKASK